jgi:lipid-A-disaccharide synthase-like uncharacterized protein
MNVFHEFISVIAQPMAVFGILGQGFFSGRFLIQWIVSEKRQESTIPLAFWYFSIVGALMTFVYAVWRRDPVFTVAQASGLFIYTRNLILIRRKKRALS